MVYTVKVQFIKDGKVTESNSVDIESYPEALMAYEGMSEGIEDIKQGI